MSIYFSFIYSSVKGLLQHKNKKCIRENCQYCDEYDCSTKHCVYRINCKFCQAFYIGESKRTMRSRLSEHITQETSQVFQHLRTHHSIPMLDHIKWTIVHHNIFNTGTRRRVELSEINLKKPTINIQLMNFNAVHD